MTGVKNEDQKNSTYRELEVSTLFEIRQQVRWEEKSEICSEEKVWIYHSPPWSGPGRWRSRGCCSARGAGVEWTYRSLKCCCVRWLLNSSYSYFLWLNEHSDWPWLSWRISWENCYLFHFQTCWKWSKLITSLSPSHSLSGRALINYL